MEIAVLLFDGLTTLDAVGPIEVIGRLPQADVKFVAKRKGELRASPRSSGLGLIADYALSEVTRADILVVPGGPKTQALCDDPEVIGWVQATHRTTTWTTSVCTGSLILGAAGLLRGLRATSHWQALERLAEYGAIPSSERVIVQGKIITSAGVSSGIDMALRLVALVAGETFAKATQLQIEYDPQPPYDVGCVTKAPAEIIAFAKAAAPLR
ncbi:MAG: DJ-1/PfpI family protein [Alphaproteobacteria bacterium]|nr:DJ-1/PfpI family protein [Alphaproteobacteria bacterium]